MAKTQIDRTHQQRRRHHFRNAALAQEAHDRRQRQRQQEGENDRHEERAGEIERVDGHEQEDADEQRTHKMRIRAGSNARIVGLSAVPAPEAAGSVFIVSPTAAHRNWCSPSTETPLPPQGSVSRQGPQNARRTLVRQPAVTADAVFGCFHRHGRPPGPRNILHLMFDPLRMRPFVANWPDVARDCSSVSIVNPLAASSTTGHRPCCELLAYPDVKGEWKNPVAIGFMPTIPLGLIRETAFSTIFRFTTARRRPSPECASVVPGRRSTEIHHAEMMRRRQPYPSRRLLRSAPPATATALPSPFPCARSAPLWCRRVRSPS